jgi:hypothetical protein
LAAALTAVAAPALAQDAPEEREGPRARSAAQADAARFLAPPPGIQESFQPDYTRADLAVFVEILGLDDDQQVVLDMLFGDYETAFEQAVAAARSRRFEPPPSPQIEKRRRTQEETQDEIDRLLEEARQKALATEDIEARRAIMREVQARVAELQQKLADLIDPAEAAALGSDAVTAMIATVESWEPEKAALRETFTADVRGMLREEQAGRWPQLERTLRRRKTISRGVLGGESIDLLDLVDGMARGQPDGGAAVRTAAAPVLAAYEVRLDEALVARDQEIVASRRDQLDATARGDWEKALDLTRRQIVLHARVRDVNEEHLRALASALPPADGAGLKAAFDLQAFPRIYRPTRAARMLEAARGLRDLDDATRQTIGGLQAAFAEEVASVNEQLREATRAHEPMERQQRFERQAARFADLPEEDDPGEDPIRALDETRRQLEERFVQRLEAMLTPEQFASLPGSGRRATAPPRQ